MIPVSPSFMKEVKLAASMGTTKSCNNTDSGILDTRISNAVTPIGLADREVLAESDQRDVLTIARVFWVTSPVLPRPSLSDCSITIALSPRILACPSVNKYLPQ